MIILIKETQLNFFKYDEIVCFQTEEIIFFILIFDTKSAFFKEYNNERKILIKNIDY